MITNLVATLSFVLVTNWTEAKITNHRCSNLACEKLHFPDAVLVGRRSLNTFANFEYKGKNYSILIYTEDAEELILKPK